MNKITALIGVGALAFAATAVQAQETLRVGTEGAYPPYNYTDASGSLVGFEIELGRELAERMGTEAVFIPQDWDGIIPALLNGRYDVIMAGMSINDERRERINFTQGYVTTPAWFVAPEDSELQSAETFEEVRAALEGESIGVQVSTIHQAFLEENIPETDIRLYDTQEQLNLDLASGRVDAGLADGPAWAPFLESADGEGFDQFGPGLTGADFAVFGEGVGIGVRKEDEELLARLNAALCEMKADGSLAELATEWFGFDTSMPADPAMCG